MHHSIVVMGVSGSGKSTVGRLLATKLEMRFVAGDDLQPAVNKTKMAAGNALNDTDREPWLDAIAAVLSHGPVVVACSALTRRYRERLRKAAPTLKLVYLQGTRELLAQRLAGRSHEFMPPTLLESQLMLLEPPSVEEQAVALDIQSAPEELVDRTIELLT